MTIEFLGPSPHETDAQGRPVVRIGTVFPKSRTVVTLPVMHFLQRMAYRDLLQERSPTTLSSEELDASLEQAVDFIREGDKVLIRPDPQNMELAFAGDEILSEIYGRKRVRYLFVQQQRVRDAIKRRGECWRINPLPQSAREMEHVIRRAKMAIGGREIYYYSNETGTRFLTFDRFAQLATLSDEDLLAHLLEISVLATSRPNRLGNPEIEFFLADDGFTQREFEEAEFATMNGEQLRTAYLDLREKFRRAVPKDVCYDDIRQIEWRTRMYSALIGRKDEELAEEELLGLSPEFHLQIRWLPGGRFEDGGLILDPVTRNSGHNANLSADEIATHEKVRAFVINFIREYGELEYVNVGRVEESLSNREKLRLTEGRREVYVAELCCPGQREPTILMIRMQKYGVQERLREGKNLGQAMIESEEYTDYVMDRRLACRQLGMNLTQRMTIAKITETYHSPDSPSPGFTIWTPYFERDYVHGIATDKIARHRYADSKYALALARLLGAAAAPNMIVGRCDLDRKVVFDDGDELVVEDDRGLPERIIMSDQMGSFRDYGRDLIEVADAYAQPIRDRAAYVPDRQLFAEAYLESFAQRFLQIQETYRVRRGAFDCLFSHRRYDDKGSFAYRWEMVLQRLDRAHPQLLADAIRAALDASHESSGTASRHGPDCEMKSADSPMSSCLK